MSQVIFTSQAEFAISNRNFVSSFGQRIGISDTTSNNGRFTQKISSNDIEDVTLYSDPTTPIEQFTLDVNTAYRLTQQNGQIFTNGEPTYRDIDDSNYIPTTGNLTFNRATYVKLRFKKRNKPKKLRIGNLFIKKVEISCSIESARSLSVEAYGKRSDFPIIQQKIRSGVEINYCGETWVITNCTKEVLKSAVELNLQLKLIISLTSKIASYTQKITWLENQEASRIIDFNTLATRAGITSELPPYQIVIPEEGIYGQTVDWFSYAKDIANIHGSILLYRETIQHINIIDVKEPTKTIKSRQLRSTISISESNANNNVNEYHEPLGNFETANLAYTAFDESLSTNQLSYSGDLPILSRVFDYYRAEITGDLYLSENAAIKEEVNTTAIIDRTFIRRTRRFDRIINGSRDFPSFMNGNKIVDSVTISFDKSGHKQSYSEKETLDGKSIRDREWLYGFAVTGRDIKDGKTLLNTWVVYEYRETNYHYGAYDYYLGETTTGWRLVRETEEDDREPESFDLELTDPTINQYLFIQIPIDSSGKYLELEKSTDYYPTTDDPLAGYFINNDAVLQEDPTYVPVWLVLKEEEWKVTYTTYTSETDGLTRYSGSEYIKTIQRNIFNSLLTNTAYFLNATNFSEAEKEKISREEYYTETVSESGSDGEQFRNGLGVGGNNVIQGRPPQGDRLPSLYEESQENNEDDKPVLLKDLYGKIYANSVTGYTGASRHSVSVNRARTLLDVERKLKLDWLLNNARGNQLNTAIELDLSIYEGEFIKLEFSDIIVYGYVLSYSHTLYSLQTDDNTELIDNTANSYTRLTIGLIDKAWLDDLDNIVKLDKNKRSVSLFAPQYIGTRLRGPNRLTGNNRYS